MATKPRTIRKPATAKAVADAKRATEEELRAGLKEQVVHLHELRAQGKQLDIDIAKTQESILDTLDELGESTVTVSTPNGPLKATRVQNSSIRMDEAALKSKVGAKLWSKITTLVLDKKKLEAFVASGEIDPLVVAECSQEVTSKPFIRT